jgi:hypothetical protein
LGIKPSSKDFFLKTYQNASSNALGAQTSNIKKDKRCHCCGKNVFRDLIQEYKPMIFCLTVYMEDDIE